MDLADNLIHLGGSEGPANYEPFQTNHLGLVRFWDSYVVSMSSFHSLAEMPNSNVLLYDRRGNQESLTIIGVHGDTVHQLIIVGKALLVELLF
jgi:hypothetical protein